VLGNWRQNLTSNGTRYFSINGGVTNIVSCRELPRQARDTFPKLAGYENERSIPTWRGDVLGTF